MVFADVLEVKNGRNQKSVENPNGKYPIYGSGGIMGYADSYLCDANTVIIGRKGSINNPIFVEEPFWNVDTAFGLITKKEILLPKYLYYFCVKFDFLKLNKAVTIPSLTKSDILKIEINVPKIEKQQKIVSTLDTLQSIITHRRTQLEKLDLLVKARFVEMFGDPNDKRVSEKQEKIGDLCDVTKLAGFEFTEYINYQESGEIIMLRGLNCKQGKLVLDNVKYIDRNTSYNLPRSRLYAGDILMTYAGTIGEVAIVDEDDKYHLAPNVAKISIIKKDKVNPIFLVHLFMYSHDYIMTFASQVAQASINMQKIRDFKYTIPNIEEQYKFADFVKQVDKFKATVQKALDEAQLLFDSLMQEYFG